MDTFDSYSDSSTGTPRTPSPQEYLPLPPQHSFGGKPGMDVYHGGGLLQELYDYDSPYSPEWQHPQQQQHLQQQQQQQQQQPHTMVRRATFPYVRQDHGHHHQQFLPQPPPPPQSYADYPIKQEDPSAAFYRQHQQQHQQYPPLHAHPGHSPYQQHQPLAPAPYLSPHTGLPVQHTDDAASKETQYLRRRCFNCHTTEPPSWRRSTLNPGKIVCNKCGLYERTHLRPRPLRFDELRAGGKARKGAGKAGGMVGHLPMGGVMNGVPMGMPNSPPMSSPKIKKEPGLHRRSSVSSNASTGAANSDWDDNVSIYSNSSTHSAPPTSFSSPSIPSFPLQPPSPPSSSDGIRLPNNPLAELHQQHSHPSLYQAYQQQAGSHSPQLGLVTEVPQSPGQPRKSHSVPVPSQQGGLVNAYPPSVPEMNEWASPEHSPQPQQTGSPQAME